MPVLLVIFALGSEVRQFNHSGLLTELLNAGWKVVVAAKIVDEDLCAQLDSRISFRSLPNSHLPLATAQLEIAIDSAHSIREARQGKAGWKYQAAKPKNWRQRLLFSSRDLLAYGLALSSVGFRIAQKVEAAQREKLIDDAWKRLYCETAADVVLLNVPKVSSLQPALTTAQALGIPTALFYHTWKDAAAAGRLSHRFTALGVWNTGMKQALLRQNLWLDHESIHVIGCSHFDCVGRRDWLMPEDEFRHLVGAYPSSQMILYPAAAPWVVPNEERYINLLSTAIKQGTLPPNTQLVVRLNPMDQTNQLAETLRLHYPEVLVLKPDWRWDQKRNWCFQRSGDLMLYNSLLHYVDVCVGVPSTVTVECAVADLPVVNLGFDLPGSLPLPGSMRLFWDADFYELVKESGAAQLALSPEEFVCQIATALTNRSEGRTERQFLLKRQLGILPPSSASTGAALLSTIAIPTR